RATFAARVDEYRIRGVASFRQVDPRRERLAGLLVFADEVAGIGLYGDVDRRGGALCALIGVLPAVDGPVPGSRPVRRGGGTRRRGRLERARRQSARDRNRENLGAFHGSSPQRTWVAGGASWRSGSTRSGAR